MAELWNGKSGCGECGRSFIYSLRFTVSELEIVDMPGRVQQSEMEVDVSKLSPGIYFLQLKSEKGMVVKRFVKE